MELGLFKIKETTINHSNGSTSISKTPKVTGKGQQYFVNKLRRLEVQVIKMEKEQKKSPASEETGHNMKKLELKTEKNNVPMTNWSRVIVETAESNPKLIAIVTNNDFELANGFRVRLQPIYKDQPLGGKLSLP